MTNTTTPATKTPKPKKPKVYKIGPVEGTGPSIKAARIDARNKAEEAFRGIRDFLPTLVYEGGKYGVLVHRDAYGCSYRLVTFGPKGAETSTGFSMGGPDTADMLRRARRHVAQLTEDREIAHRLLSDPKDFAQWAEYRRWQKRMRFAMGKGLPDLESREYASYGPKYWPKAKRAKNSPLTNPSV